MNSLQRFRHLNKVFNHFGAPATLFRISDRVLQTSGIEVHKVMWQDCSRFENRIPPDPRCTFRKLEAEEVEFYSGDPENRIPESFAERARSSRHLCFATFCDQRLAAYAWYALGSIDAQQNAGVAMSYPADTACVYHAFTLPAFRGQLLHAGVRPRLLAALAKHGITKLVALVSWTNWPSLRYCNRVGYQDLGYLLTIGPRRHRWWFAPRRATARGIQFGSDHSPDNALNHAPATLVGGSG